jgi:carboxypeptidase C (cathepsin A)
MKILVLLITLIVCISAADDGDWVDPFDLPIEFPVRGFYAGYLNITQTKALYYVYTPSDRNPSKDPLVILLPPGPGCSPLQSFLYSKGPFIFVSNTTNFRDNPFNWNK